MKVTCAICGTVAERSGGVAIYCIPCAHAKRARLATPGRVRNGQLKPLRADGIWRCLDCLAPADQTVINGRKRRPALRCNPCRSRHYTELRDRRQPAGTAVAKAIRAGELLPAKAFKCVDCERPATVYDHRDYSKPLAVEPVCRSCNVMRGPAAEPAPDKVGA